MQAKSVRARAAREMSKTRTSSPPGLAGGPLGIFEPPADPKPTAPAMPMNAMRPLIMLWGETSITCLLKYLAENDGFRCVVAADIAEAVALTAAQRPNAIVLDDEPPGSALAARRTIFENHMTRQIPALILGGPAFQQGRSGQLLPAQTGFMLKPFLPEAFLGRLYELVGQTLPAVGSHTIRFADIVLQLDAHRVYRGSRLVRLGPIEYRVLRKLIEQPRKVLSRDHLLIAIGAQPEPSGVRAVDVHISRIRKALCVEGEVDLIRTVRGVGYSLDTTADRAAAGIQVSRRLQAASNRTS